MEHVTNLHNIIINTVQTHPVGALFMAGAIAAMAIQTGVMYRFLRVLLLPVIITVACYGIYGIYHSGTADTFILGLICCGFGYVASNYFVLEAREAWFPETVLKKYKSVPEQPDLKTLSRAKLIEEYVKLHQLATNQEMQINEFKEAEKNKSDTGDDPEDETDESGIKLEIKT